MGKVLTMIAALTLSSVALAQGSNVNCPYKADTSASQISDQKSERIVDSLLGSSSTSIDTRSGTKGSATR